MTPEDKQQSSDGWMCWDLFCHKFNASENSVCYDCGNHRGYQPPELESLIKQVLQSQLEELEKVVGKDHPIFGHGEDWEGAEPQNELKAEIRSAIKEMMEKL